MLSGADIFKLRVSEYFNTNIPLFRPLEYRASLLILITDIDIDLAAMNIPKPDISCSPSGFVSPLGRLQNEVHELLEKRWAGGKEIYEAAIHAERDKLQHLQSKSNIAHRALCQKVEDKEALLNDSTKEHLKQTILYEGKIKKLQLTIDEQKRTILTLQEIKVLFDDQMRNHEALTAALHKQVSDKQITITNLTAQNQTYEATIKDLQTRIDSYQKRPDVAREALLGGEAVMVAHKTNLPNPMMSKSQKPKTASVELMDLSARVTKPHAVSAKTVSTIDPRTMQNPNPCAADSISIIKYWNRGELDRSRPHVLWALQNAFRDKFGFNLTPQELSSLDRYRYGVNSSRGPLYTAEMNEVFRRNERDRNATLERMGLPL